MITLEIMKKDERKEIEAIYNSEFPKEERKPFSLLLKSSRKKKAELFAIHDTELNLVVGLAFFLIKDDKVLFDYFAIKKEYQGGGYGTEVLRLVRDKYRGRKIFGEVEYPDENADNNEQRIRRLDFYLRNGLVETGIIIIFFGCTLELLCFDENKVTYEEYKEFLYSIFGFFGRKLINRNIHLVRE